MDGQPPHQPDRREFLTKACAISAGAIAVLVPAASGIFVALDPLRQGPGESGAVKVTSLSALPEDGTPRKFSILATRVDAWNRTPNVPVGAVYLRRVAPDKVVALNVVCPHAGCFVEHSGDGFLCPCHNSRFHNDGAIADPKSPSPRGLDELPVEVREGGEVWVRFQNFRAGTKERIPV